LLDQNKEKRHLKEREKSQLLQDPIEHKMPNLKQQKSQVYPTHQIINCITNMSHNLHLIYMGLGIQYKDIGKINCVV